MIEEDSFVTNHELTYATDNHSHLIFVVCQGAYREIGRKNHGGESERENYRLT